MSNIKDLPLKSQLEESDNKDEKIPILLLSKGLMDQLDSTSDDDIIEIEKKEKNSKDINNYFHSSESSNDEEPDSKTKKEENKNPNFNKKENQKDIKNPEIISKNNENNTEIFQSKLYQSSTLYEFIKNKQEKGNEINKNNKKINNDENPLFINSNNNYNYYNDNNNYNQPIYINSCFTMNGKTGWICSYCKNFNYESKFII